MQTYKVEHEIKGLDTINEKVNRLSEILKEAKTLADELASCDVKISLMQVIKSIS